MGIESTRYIDREMAIERIVKIDALIIDKNYREIESVTFEGDSDLAALVNKATPLKLSETELDKWTDDMLADQMDYPLYRFSMFDNYLIGDEPDYD